VTQLLVAVLVAWIVAAVIVYLPLVAHGERDRHVRGDLDGE